MDIMVLMGSLLGTVLLLGSVGSVFFMKSKVSSLKRMSKSELTEKASLVLHDADQLHLIPSWMFAFDGKLSAMLFVASAVLAYSSSPEQSSILLAIGCLSWAIGAWLFISIQKRAKEGIAFLSNYQLKNEDSQDNDILSKTLDLLSKRVVGIEKRQANTIEMIVESQKVLQGLPDSIQKSLQDSVNQALAPALLKMFFALTRQITDRSFDSDST